jgi:hypothetical protein
MSALPPKADICGANGNVRYGTIADIPPSMVVSDQLGARGRTILISVNSPGRVSTSIVPACCFTMMSWLIERPRPVPSPVGFTALLRRQPLAASRFGCFVAPSHCLPRGSAQGIVTVQISTLVNRCDVRFGSLVDIRAAKRHVRFTPKSGHVRCNWVSAKGQKQTSHLIRSPRRRRQAATEAR